MIKFVVNIPKRLRIESQKLDAQAALCDKAWTVFNDEGVKQLFIFQPDGSLLITINGEVYNSTWKYLPVNNSVVITSEGKSTMFHPAFIDSIVFALGQDGGKECLFLIDEENQKAFSPKTLSELEDYFDRKELLLLEQDRKRKELEERNRREREVREKEEAEYRRKREEEDRERAQKEDEQQIRKEAFELEQRLSSLEAIFGIVAGVIAFFTRSYWTPAFTSEDMQSAAGIIQAVLYSGILGALIGTIVYTIRVYCWKNTHPNDPRNKHIHY